VSFPDNFHVFEMIVPCTMINHCSK